MSNLIEEMTTIVEIPDLRFSTPIVNIVLDNFDITEHSYSKVEKDPLDFGGAGGGVVEFYPKYVFECAVCSVIFLRVRSSLSQ